MKTTIIDRWEGLLAALRPSSGYLLLALGLLLFSGHQGQGLGVALLGILALLLAWQLLPQLKDTSVVAACLGAVFMAGIATNLMSHPSPGMGTVGMLPLLILGLTFWMGAQLPETAERKALGIVGGLALLCAAHGLPERYNHTNVYESWFLDYNSAGTLFNLGVFSFLALWQGTRRHVFLVPAAVLVTAIVYSASRGALLTLAFGLVLVAVHARKRIWALPSKIKGLAAGGVVLGLGGLAYIAKHHGMLERMSRLGSDESTSGRWAMWVASWQMYRDHNWLTGAGLGLWGQLYPNYRQGSDFESAGSMAHNDYIHILAEAGPVLALTVVLLAAYTVWRAVSARSTPVRATAAAGAALAFAHASFNFPLHNVQLSAAIGLLAGIAMARPAAGRRVEHVTWTRRTYIAAHLASFPVLAWLLIELTVSQAAFGIGSWQARILPEFGKLPVVERLFGEYGERSLTTMPTLTLATHYLLLSMAKHDSLDENRAYLTKALEVYRRAPVAEPDTFVPAQVHLLLRGLDANLYDREVTLKQVHDLLVPLLKKHPNRSDNRIMWADYVNHVEGYAAAKAYLEAERARATSLSFNRKVQFWLKLHNPERPMVTGTDLLGAR